MSFGGMARQNVLESLRSLAGMITKGMCLCLLLAGCASRHVAVMDSALRAPSPDASVSVQDPASVVVPPVGPPPPPPQHPKRANFEREPKSASTRHLADWVVDSGDNQGMPFLIIDKKDAKVFAFHADGRLRGAAPALLGLAQGDDTVPGIGDRELRDIRPEERTTPAGRFVAVLGFEYNGKDILWVDYDTSLSLHRVVTGNPVEHRLERLSSPTVLDNRISFGCINVPEKFYDNVVKPAFTGTYGIVYILPEKRSTKEIFASYYDVDDAAEQVLSKTPPRDQKATVIDLLESLDPG